MATHGQFFPEGEHEQRVRRRVADRGATPAQAPGSAADVLARLQRSAGNTAVNALLRQYMYTVQREEAVEEEEEEGALMRQYAAQREEAVEEEEEEGALMQTKREGGETAPPAPEVGLEGGPISTALADRVTSQLGGGAPLDAATRTRMEGAFGTSFADVHVHTDSEAHALNKSVSATAFTTGKDIFFSQGAYDPGSSTGQQLLAHELTHVVQQSTMSQGGPLTVGPAGDSHEQEADATSAVVARAIDDGKLGAEG